MKTQDLWTDPIVEEIHRIREEMVAEAGGDLASLGAWLMKRQDRHAEGIVQSPPPRPVDSK